MEFGAIVEGDGLEILAALSQNFDQSPGGFNGSSMKEFFDNAFACHTFNQATQIVLVSANT